MVFTGCARNNVQNSCFSLRLLGSSAARAFVGGLVLGRGRDVRGSYITTSVSVFPSVKWVQGNIYYCDMGLLEAVGLPMILQWVVEVRLDSVAREH